MDSTESTPQAPAWTVLPRVERRIVGVLVEKAKTTPDQYPLSLNALTSGCNQKSNRSPQMNLETDEVEEALDRLRERGVVGEVHGGGRVARYRHYVKDWMGVDGTELAVMAELLLRGAQTVGELRGRAARMAAGQLSDLSALRPVLNALQEKGLVVALSPEGRGQIVAHAMFEESEMEKVRREFSGGGPVAPAPPRPQAPPPPVSASASSPAVVTETDSTTRAAHHSGTTGIANNDVAELRAEVASLRDELARLKNEIEDIWSNLR